MKKIFTLLLALLSIPMVHLFATTITHQGVTYYYYNHYIYKGNGNGGMYGRYYTTLQSGKNASGFITIPEYIYEHISNNTYYYDITDVRSGAFAGNLMLTGVDVKAPISIYALFSNCSNLKEIVIGPKVKIENMYATLGIFSGCYNLKDITISESHPSCVVDSAMILNLQKTTLLAFPSASDSLLLSEGITKIGRAGLENTLVKYVSLPSTLDTIEEYAFAHDTLLTTIVIPSSVKYIGRDAFTGCKRLKKVYYNGSIEEWTSIAFMEKTSNPCCNNADLYIGMELIDTLKTEKIMAINSYAFAGCTSLTSVIVSNNITSIGNDAFYDCVGLTSVHVSNLALWCKINFYNEYSNPLCYAHNLYLNKEKIVDLVIPDSITSIGNSVFTNCYSLNSVTIGNDVTSIGDDAFSQCKNLTSVIWNAENCSDFDSNSAPFYNIRTNITSFILGEEVEHIPAYLCYGMTKVPEIIVSNCKATIGSNAFWGCKYKVPGIYNIFLPDTTLCYGDELIIDGMKCDLEPIPNVKQTWKRTLKTVEGCDSVVEISVLWKQISRYPSITTNHEQDYANSGSISWQFIECPDYEYDYYSLNGKKNASTYGLSGGDYRLVFYNEQCEDSVVKDITIYQFGIKINGIYYTFDREAKTAMVTFRGVSHDYYENEYSGNLVIPDSVKLKGVTYYVNSIQQDAFYHCDNITSITIQGSKLLPVLHEYGYEARMNINKNIPIYVPFGSLNDYKSSLGFNNLNLHVINPKNVSGTNGATSATITFGNEEDAAHIASCGIVESDTTAGNILEYIGLEPNSEYKDIPFFIITEEGDYDTLHYSFKTEALTLTTKESKPVSETTALLFAETNMSDAETNCGFEWKRENAPEGMAGTKVFCPVASGMMAGRLKNLKDDVYYKYRAFYQSAAGQMYYGEWQYIFTGDVTVEFDPVLYTYSATVVKETEATISGYALAGAADFTEQGFEYWAESRVEAQGSKDAMKRMPAALGEHFFVQASGINMRVTLTDLDPGTVYKYRAYGKVGDQVYYGAEQSFTTRGTYVAPSYLITFLNWDGTELQKSQVATGTLPEYTGVTPVRPDDEQYTYIFKGWTPELVAVTADAVYTAEFYAEEATAIDNVQTPNVQCTKLIENGVLYLIFNGTKYNVQGQVVK